MQIQLRRYIFPYTLHLRTKNSYIYLFFFWILKFIHLLQYNLLYLHEHIRVSGSLSRTTSISYQLSTGYREFVILLTWLPKLYIVGKMFLSVKVFQVIQLLTRRVDNSHITYCSSDEQSMNVTHYRPTPHLWNSFHTSGS